MLIKSLINENPNEFEKISNLANISAYLFDELENVNWVGFYLFDDNQLYLGPFKGKVACTHISLDKGVCGKAATTKETIIVDDVHKFPTHIACDANSKSEIVVPILNSDNTLYGVLDCDSPITNRFAESEKKYFEAIVKEIEKYL